jgi:cytochrome b
MNGCCATTITGIKRMRKFMLAGAASGKGQKIEAKPVAASFRGEKTSGGQAMSTTRHIARVAVWDPLVRYGHWALVAAFAIAYLSAEEESSGGPNLPHVWGGYAVGIIVVLRVLWGLIGSSHARFSGFICGPVTVLRYLLDLVRGHARRYLGHSPAGGAMVITLLVCLAATVGTGLAAYGDQGRGPLAATGGAVIIVAHADQDGGLPHRSSDVHGRGAESLLSGLHGTLANITLVLVILHVLGVGLASLVHRENLVSAMFSGQKRAGE